MGSNERRPNRKRTIEELRFYLLMSVTVDPVTGCWMWNRSLSDSGYVSIKHHGRPIRGHRLSAHLFMDFDLDNPLDLLHHCDRPACINPLHTFAGTHQQNMLDMVAKGRHRGARVTHCPKGHEYTPENNALYGGKKCCRKCHAARALRYYYKKAGQANAARQG